MGRGFKAFANMVQILVCKAYHRVEYIGRENILPNENYLVLANHVSNADVVALYGIIPNMKFMAKEELFKIPIISTIIKKGGAFKVSRGKQDYSSLLNCVKLLKDNSVLIFPEGTRHARQKGIQAKQGAMYIANIAKVKVLPVYLTEKRSPFSKIQVIIGKPVSYANEKIPKEKLQEEMNKIMEKIYNLGEKYERNK